MNTKPQKIITLNDIMDAKSTPSNKVLDITNDFLNKKKQESKNKDANLALQDFALVARLLVTQYETFSFNDVIQCTRHFDTKTSELSNLFHLWVNELKSKRKIKIHTGVYNYPTFTWY